MLICIKKSTGELVPEGGGTYYGRTRESDKVPARGSRPVRVRYYDDDGFPTLIEAGSVLYFDCKPPGKYNSRSFTLSLTITVAPIDPATGDYEGTLDTNKDEANALLSPNDPDGTNPDATEPDSVTLMAQLCWQGPSDLEPNRSGKWSVVLDNSIRQGLEGIPTPATPGYATLTALLNLFAAERILLAPQTTDFRRRGNASLAVNL